MTKTNTSYICWNSSGLGNHLDMEISTSLRQDIWSPSPVNSQVTNKPYMFMWKRVRTFIALVNIYITCRQHLAALPAQCSTDCKQNALEQSTANLVKTRPYAVQMANFPLKSFNTLDSSYVARV